MPAFSLGLPPSSSRGLKSLALEGHITFQAPCGPGEA